ncbi:type IV pilus modification PilV family protein [Mucisphaera sp.]|uniref:type IV pilus modification PilV family protein n=1 Tax=Mucisphaera sp. TaxID=2913024 RepID=UPI003D0AECFB
MIAVSPRPIRRRLNRPQNRASRRGYTLIEMLVSAGILAFGLILLSALFPVGGIARKNAADDTFAHTHARNVLAVLQAMGADGIDDAAAPGVITAGDAFVPFTNNISLNSSGIPDANPLSAGLGESTAYGIPFIAPPAENYIYQAQLHQRGEGVDLYGPTTENLVARYPRRSLIRDVTQNLRDGYDRRVPEAVDASVPTYEHRLLVRRPAAGDPYEVAVFVFRREEVAVPEALVINDFDRDGDSDSQNFGDITYWDDNSAASEFRNEINLTTGDQIGDLNNSEVFDLEFDTGGIRNHRMMIREVAPNTEPTYIAEIVGSFVHDSDELVAVLGSGRPPAFRNPATVGSSPAAGDFIEYEIYWLPARTAAIVTGIIP